MRPFKKIAHLFKVYFNHGKTLQELSQHTFGNEIITAYLQSKKKKPIDKKLLGVFEYLETYRKQLLKNTTQIDYAVFEKGLKRRVSEICKSAATPTVWSSFYYHLIRNSKSLHVLEIGTNLGISGQYFLSALKHNVKKHNQKGVFTSIEGVKGLCDIAQQRFKEIDQDNLVDITVHNALYDDILPQIVKEGVAYQIVFVDGNHKYEPTLDYYEWLLKTTTENAIFIFDDINWNVEMQRAWNEILQRKHHAYSIDFYKLGIVVVDKNATNPIENFKLYLRF